MHHCFSALVAFMICISAPFASTHAPSSTVTHLIFFIFIFPAVLRYSRHITLRKFKVCNVMLWYTYILIYVYTTVRLVNTSITSHSFLFVCVVRTFKVYSLSNFQGQLTLEQHGFELQGSTYRYFFPTKYVVLYYRICDWLNPWIQSTHMEEPRTRRADCKSYVGFWLRRRSVPLIPKLFKGQLYTIQCR